MPPAVEIARAISATPVSRTGTAFISSANWLGGMAASGVEPEIAASCINPMAAGKSVADLRRWFDIDALPRGTASRRARSAVVRSGRRSIFTTASPCARMASRSGADSA